MLLLQISEIQRPKANHNSHAIGDNVMTAVTNIRNSKTESKSQRVCCIIPYLSGCYKYQKFKDRKQITTSNYVYLRMLLLLQISEIQRPKANHNNKMQLQTKRFAVTNIRNSKTESKSQPRLDR